MKKTYIKHNFKYWTVKKLNKHSLKFWYFLIACMALITVWAVINRQVNKGGLVDPRVSHVVTQVMASELKKESTRAWKMYQEIRWLESNNGTKGLAVTCKNKGGVNEVGFLPYKGFCFKSEWDQELTVMNYIEKRLNNGWTINEVKCYWNEGVKRNNCPYALNDLANSK